MDKDPPTTNTTVDPPPPPEDNTTPDPLLQQPSPQDDDRISQILSHYASSDTPTPLPAHLRRAAPTPEELADLESSLVNHPFFITQSQIDALSPSEPLPPLLDALQQLKYSPDENTPLELALNYKTDGLFQFKMGKYRIAASIFSEAIKTLEQSGEKNGEEEEEVTAKIDALLPTLYNNRGVCQFHVDNFRSALTDFKKALKLKPDYEKSWKKGIECCVKLEKWEEAGELLEGGKSVGMKDVELEKKILMGKGNAQLSRHKEKSAKAKLTKEAFVLMERIRKSGVKMLNANFLQVEGGSDAVVRIDADELVWPVLLYYPEYSTSDFVKEFRETDEFLPHLHEMLDVEPPNWDKNHEYGSADVDVYYVDGQRGGWVMIEEGTALRDVMRQERYYLPTNGVPGFFILSKKSEFCKFFLERMK
ncbi:DNA polymerase interacting tetratricopeptide repeat-containing, protein of 47 kDa [Folsomia candida]|nr:DNA polymerase interacting tetratricopeptide repeat-containing, protein of 47 kDa [Folsomia candida]